MLHRSHLYRLAALVLGSGLILAPGCARGTAAFLGGGPPPPDPDGGGGDPIDPPPGPTDFSPTAGLVSAVAGPGIVRLDWRRPHEAPDDYELALFQDTQRNGIFASSPVAVDLAGTSLFLPGLTDGVRLFFGLGIRERDSGAAFTPTGVVLAATPGPVVYVDFSASPDGANGTTPETAFPDPRLAILVAGFSLGGGNVWIRAGTYSNVGFIPQGAGIHVYGGFDASFDLATRDLSPSATVLAARADTGTPTIVIEIQQLPSIPIDDPIAILDGLTLTGGSVARQGIQITESAAELRSLTVEGFLQRGVRLQSTASEDFDVVVAGSSFSRNGAEGLDGNGPFDYFVDGCEFNSNVQEGFDLDDWIAPPGESVALRISACRFFGNGAEGLDVDLNVPPFVLDLTGGRFVVEIRGSAFERNGLDGMLLDIEYELFPTWSAELVVRECMSRSNRQNGFQFDLDAAASTFCHQLLAIGNGSAGIHVSSESHPDVAVIAASVAAGNLGEGLVATGPPVGPGNCTLAVSHCIVAGNQGPGIASRDHVATAASTIAHLQSLPDSNTDLVASVVIDDPVAPAFLNAAIEYATVTAISPEGALTLSGPSTFGPGATIEIADDGTARTVQTVVGNVVTVDPAPDLVVTPDVLCAFPDKAVIEDFRLASGTSAIGAGMVAPGAPPIDAGVFGALQEGGVPGFASEIRRDIFHPTTTTPAPSEFLTSFASLEIAFNAEIDPASASAATLRVLDDVGNEIAAGVNTEAERLLLSPPPGGWNTPTVRVELYSELRSTSGLENAAPLILRFATGL